MTADFTPLRTELAIWRRERLTLPLWWRDDDAVQPIPALERLLALSTDLGLPVHLAVIPLRATTALADRLADEETAVALVHGWAHENHAPPDQKKAEFGHPRPDAAAQTADALERLKALFGPRLLEMFVPPWNRIDPEMIARIAAQGYRALSTYTPRLHRLAAPGLVQINTHADPIHWRGGGGLVPPEELIGGLVTLLQNRRAGLEDAAEPLGFLTHHLVHDDAIWGVTERCLATLLEGGAVPTNLLERRDDLP